MTGSSIFYSLTKNFFRVIFTLYNRLEVHNAGNIPVGTVIVAANHASNADPPLIGAVFPRRLRYLAKESLFENPLLGTAITQLGAIPVKREDSQRAGVVMKLMLSILENGESLLLFPEGSRSRDGRLKPLEGGAAFLAAKSGLPVVPVYIRGSSNISPPGTKFPRPAKMTVTFGEAIRPDRGKPDRQARSEIQAALEETLYRLQEEGDRADD